MHERRQALLATVTCGLLAAAPLAHSQESPGPPPAPGKGDYGPSFHELLPGIGRIGAQVGLLGGASWNPYRAGRGIQGGGYIDLPLTRVPGGKLSCEILIALSTGRSEPFTATNPMAFVANLAAGASRDEALAGPPRAPFPVKRSVRSHLRLLQVAPVSFKYTLTGLDHARLRPYVTAGFDVVVAISREVPEADESLDFRGTSPFDDPLIGGLVAQAPELAERGTPSGQGNIQAGGHAGAGLELRLARGVSLGVDYRFTAIEGRARLHSVSSSLGVHW